MFMNQYKVVYLILAHRFPSQVKRLVERLQGDSAKFYIHVDIKTEIGQFQKLFDDRKDVIFLQERFACRWGTFGLTEATLSGVSEIDKEEKTFDHLVVLSGQDYPIRSKEEFIQFLGNNREKSFVHRAPMDSLNNPELLTRIEKYYLNIPFNKAVIYPYDSSSGLIKKQINTILKASGMFPLPRIIPNSLQPFFWVKLDNS